MRYIGEAVLTDDEVRMSPYATYGTTEWALWFAGGYGQIDGSHHKAWVIDQVARVLLGAPVTVRMAKWNNGEREYRVEVGTCDAYAKWRGAFAQDYDEGIAP